MKKIRFLLLSVFVLIATNVFADYTSVKGVRVNQSYKSACAAMNKVAEFIEEKEETLPSSLPGFDIIATFTGDTEFHFRYSKYKDKYLNRACEIKIYSSKDSWVGYISIKFDDSEYKHRDAIYRELRDLYVDRYGRPEHEYDSYSFYEDMPDEETFTYNTNDGIEVEISRYGDGLPYVTFRVKPSN